METCVLIPPEFFLAATNKQNNENKISVWTTLNIEQGSLFYPFSGTIRSDILNVFTYLKEENIRHRFGLYDKVTSSHGREVRHCNWIRFLNVSNVYDRSVNMICTKVRGEPIYEVIKPVLAHQELVVFYFPEKPEEKLFRHLRCSFYRQTIDNILEDSPLDLSTSLLKVVNSPNSAESNCDDEHNSNLSDSSGSVTSSNDKSNDLLERDFKVKLDSQTPQMFRKSVRGERSLLPCEVCGKAFDRPSLLKRHMRTHTGEKPHICLVCGKGFSTSSSLNTHRRIHSGEKPHECQTCGKRFTASSNLYYHRMTHIKEKPHKCTLCSKSFPTPGDLKSHMYVHSGKWPFKCHICLRGFSKQTNLKNHLFLHTGDKPHVCELCDKKFALACNLRAHTKTHEGDLQDECVRCGKVFIAFLHESKRSLCSNCLGFPSASNDDQITFDLKEDTTEDEFSSGATEYSYK